MAAGAEISAFLEDLFENLAAIESALTHLDAGHATHAVVAGTASQATEYLREIFRAAHTIKGNAAMMNLTNLVALGHALETTLQEALADKLTVGREALRLFAECRAAMAGIGDALRSGKDATQIVIRDTTDRLQVLLLEDRVEALTVQGNTARDVEVRLHIARAELAPSVRAFLVETKLAELGTIVRKEPAAEKLESPEFLASARLIKFVLHTTASAAEIRENLNIDLIEDISLTEGAPVQHAGNLKSVAARNEATELGGEVHSGTADTVRLGVNILDRLLNLTGELVIANGGLIQIADDLQKTQRTQEHSLRLTEKNREIVRIAAEIQNLVMKSRMLPLEHVFSRFRRFVRDYAEKTGKAIRLEISGEKTELDKRVIDEMVKPLTHLIRNSLDHGLESPEERVAQGKSAEGTLKISAGQAGSTILISVEDDGRGMNLEKIRARAVEKNLVSAEKAARLTSEEIREFIFMAGFSTKDAADDVSGRGFGMDIVRDSIEHLSGDLSITSAEGKGTRMVVKLPLTLAILTTLTFKIRNDIFAIPLGNIEESLRVPAGRIVEVDGKEILHSRNTMLPFLRLDRLLGYPGVEDYPEGGIAAEDFSFAIVADVHGQKIALGIDEFLKKQELVVKSLGENYRPVPGLAGASMLGDNEIVFILDLAEILDIYRGTVRGQRSEVMGGEISSEPREENNLPSQESEPTYKSEIPAAVAVKTLFDTTNKDLVRKWISQSNKAAVKGIQMLTGNSAIAVKKSRGARVKAEKSRDLIEKIMNRAEDIILIHLPMLPAAGAIDLILNKTGAHRMAQLLFDAAGIKNEGEFDPSPLLEVTNILGSAYTNTLTFLTETSVEPATPTLLQSAVEIRALVDERLQTPRGEILVVENQFHIKDEDIEVELVIYLTG